ncbi:hypothetical protein CAEBREN_01946 [Caenorhabditis brenneri]|uniref:Uncharacterized protein n=1 Tax=Caenorhabditis brenneri TaxID=135651 RepID=G0NA01_CAEBE|nr:hypothetical protein CAEBREN_01946 [Caenorhabditis brenneri]
MNSEQRAFFVGRRCFQTNGTPILHLFCLSPQRNQDHQVLEKELSESGIKLGDFMKATLTPQNRLTNYEIIDYPFAVHVKGNFATMKFATAKATRDEKGILVFQTKDFGPVQSLKQDIPLGFYDIVIKAVDSTTNYNITLCAEPLATARSPIGAVNYEVPKHKIFPKNVNPTNRSELPILLVPSMNSNIPRPTSTNSYDYISSTDSMKADYVELRNCVSFEKELSLGELISALPVVNSSAPPTPKPRTITPVPMTGNQSKLKPILKVPPTKPTAVPMPTVKTMKAFVHSVLDHQNKKRMHFLWICDIKQDSVLKFPITPLQIGHFFEGVFKQQGTGSWECIQYLKPINRLIKGYLVEGKMELTAKVWDYQVKSEGMKYPIATAHHLGTVVSSLSFLEDTDTNQN